MSESVLYKVFIDLQMVYEALYQERCLNILAAYRVDPRDLWIIRTYWGRLTMVARDKGYYRPPFKGHRRVTRGEPLSPTIFNLVVDTIIRHWVTVVAAIEVGMELIILLILDLTEYFYSENGLFALTQIERL